MSNALTILHNLEAKHNVLFPKNIKELNLLYEICTEHNLPFTWEKDIQDFLNPVFDKEKHKPPHLVLYNGKKYLHVGSFQKKGGVFYYRYQLVKNEFGCTDRTEIIIDHNEMCTLPDISSGTCGIMSWNTLHNLGIVDYWTEYLKSNKADCDGFRSKSTSHFVRYKGELHCF